MERGISGGTGAGFEMIDVLVLEQVDAHDEPLRRCCSLLSHLESIVEESLTRVNLVGMIHLQRAEVSLRTP